MGQSTNDVFPTAMRLAALARMHSLLQALDGLESALRERARQFDGVVKAGRTHLQDATPIRLGQEFGGYATAIASNQAIIGETRQALRSLGLGGTAVGTGMNAHPDYRRLVIATLADLTGESLVAAPDPFDAMQSMRPFARVSAALRTLCLDLIRICNDLRLLASGPRTGLAEISVPAVQPGSSIMPGKANPVMAEMLNMVCFHVEGFLFPGTYRLARDLTINQFLATLLDEFALQLTPDLLEGFERQGLSLYQAVTLAAIVQREALVEDEMPLIASVYLNRLAMGMNLDADPTVQYAIGLDETSGSWWKSPLSLEDLQVSSPYNTYQVNGLPPGPIANPGIKVLQAVVRPAQTPYYYFRAACDGSGRHTFARTWPRIAFTRRKAFGFCRSRAARGFVLGWPTIYSSTTGMWRLPTSCRGHKVGGRRPVGGDRDHQGDGGSARSY